VGYVDWRADYTNCPKVFQMFCRLRVVAYITWQYFTTPTLL